jgi:hypothetical protein
VPHIDLDHRPCLFQDLRGSDCRDRFVSNSLLCSPCLPRYLHSGDIPTACALVANSYEDKARELAVAGLGACQGVGVIVGSIGK